jgi:type III secretion protein V
VNESKHASGRISIGLGAGAYQRMDPDGLATIAASLTSHVDALVADLGLPVRYAIAVEPLDHPTAPAQIQVGDGPARLVHRRHASGVGAEPEAIASFVADALFANRGLLVGPRPCRRLWTDWTGRAEEPPACFADLLRGLVRAGVSVTRLLDLPAPDPESAFTAQAAAAAMEEVMAGLTGRRVALIVGPRQYARFAETEAPPGTEGDGTESMDALLQLVTDGLFYELGVVFPTPLVVCDETLGPWEVRVRLNDVRAPSFQGLAPDQFLVNDTAERLALLNLEGRSAVNPANGTEGAILGDSGGAKAVVQAAGLTTWDDRQYAILHMAGVVRRNAGALVTTSVVTFLLDRLGLAFPALVRRASETYTGPRLARVLRRLVDEEISIRDLRTILEALVAVRDPVTADHSRYILFLASPGTVALQSTLFPDGPGDDMALVEMVRSNMKRYISHKHIRGANTLVAFLVAPEIERRFDDPAPLSTAEKRRLLDSFAEELGHLPSTAQTPVILTTPTVRARLRDEIRGEFPLVAVLSYYELTPETNIQPIARIDWAPSPAPTG